MTLSSRETDMADRTLKGTMSKVTYLILRPPVVAIIWYQATKGCFIGVEFGWVGCTKNMQVPVWRYYYGNFA